jgi:hypothetical protein
MTPRPYLAGLFLTSLALAGLAGQPHMPQAHAVPVHPTVAANPMLDEILVAQASPLEFLANELSQSSQRIEEFALDLARRNSPSRLKWRRAEANLNIREGILEVKLFGRAPAIIGKRSTRLIINFRIGSNLDFSYDSFRLKVSRCGRGRPICRKAKRKAKRQIAAALEANRGSIEAAINQEAQSLIGPFTNRQPF